MSQTSRSVLVLDDDSFFRQLISDILSPRGYEILEARSGRDAHQILTKVRPVLVICDYRLPDIDGMTWIQQFRDAGFNIPVVFVSGTFCDARTFSWLRNILKVSLVLQKPITAELFLQQLEGLLPLIEMETPQSDANTSSQAKDAGSALQEEYDRLLRMFPDSQDVIENAVEEIAKEAQGSTEKELIDQLRQLGRKLQVQNALNSAKQNYAKTLVGEWQRLSTAVAAFQADSENGAHREVATGIAHQLRGTAGSLGFTKVSEAAGRLEEFLNTIDVSDYTESEVIWSEVFRALSDGELAVRAEAHVVTEAEELPLTQISGKLLALTEDNELIEKLMFVQGILPIEVVIAESASNALLRIRTSMFDGILLDLNLEATKGYSELCRQIRMTPGHEDVPFAFVLNAKEPISKCDLNYIGCSAVVESSMNDSQLREEITDLMLIMQDRKPTVLTVDDDEVLSSFIASVLAPEGLVVHSLKEPINILEKMTECRPDLVILDVMMPGLSGYDVCRLLRSKDEWKHISILFLTSKSSEEGRASAFHAGADDFLSKPVLTEELTARVTSQIERVRSNRRSSDKDELTGCMLRQVFLRTLEQTISQNKSEDGSLCFFEIDDFDSLSATHGVFATEAVLKALGELMRYRFKSDVIRGCWRDKTYVLYFPSESKDDTQETINAFKRETEALRFESSAGQFRFTLSVGIGQYSEEASSARELVELSYRRLGSAMQEKPRAVFS